MTPDDKTPEFQICDPSWFVRRRGVGPIPADAAPGEKGRGVVLVGLRSLTNPVAAEPDHPKVTHVQ